MPGVLQHRRGNMIRQLRLKHPVIKPNIITVRSLKHLLLAHSELRTTGSRDFLRDISSIKQFGPSTSECILNGLATRRIAKRFETRTPGRLFAAQIREPCSLDVVCLETANGVDVVMRWIVRVPSVEAVSVGVEEDNCRREIIVVIYDVLEIGARLATFIFGSVGWCAKIVHCVDFVFPPETLSISIPLL